MTKISQTSAKKSRNRNFDLRVANAIHFRRAATNATNNLAPSFCSNIKMQFRIIALLLIPTTESGTNVSESAEAVPEHNALEASQM